MKRDFDIVVVGAGGAGLAAAIVAAENGASVLVVEADKTAGGSTGLSTGVVYGAATSVQRARGITDTPDAMFEYIMTLNTHKAIPAMVRLLSDQSAAAIEWLISLGVRFDPENLYISGVESIPRGHRATDNGVEIIQALEGRAGALGITFAFNSRVARVVLDETGMARGVEVDGEQVCAGAIILTTGGFGANQDLVAQYYQSNSEGYWYPGTPHAQGDGLLMGQQIGARIAGPDIGLGGLTVGLVQDLDSYLPGWVIFVNRHGRRFVQENAAYAVMPTVVNAQPNHDAFVIFDEAAREAAKVIVTYKPLAPSWTADSLLQFAQQGRIKRFDTLDALAEHAGLDPRILCSTVEKYNADCEAGFDSLYMKAPRFLKPLHRAPYYLAHLRQTYVGITEKGLMIDHNCRVLNELDKPISGLYAAGEVTAALPQIYPGGGGALANNFVFGRIAGKAAATFTYGAENRPLP